MDDIGFRRVHAFSTHISRWNFDQWRRKLIAKEDFVGTFDSIGIPDRLFTNAAAGRLTPVGTPTIDAGGLRVCQRIILLVP